MHSLTLRVRRYVVTATKLMHHYCKSANSAQRQGAPHTIPQLTSGSEQYCGNAATYRQTGRYRHTNRHTGRRAWPIYISRRLRLTRNVTIIGFVQFTWDLLFQIINEEKQQVILLKVSLNIRNYSRIFHSCNIRNMRILDLLRSWTLR